MKGLYEKAIHRAATTRVSRPLLLLVPSYLQHLKAFLLLLESLLGHVSDLHAASLRVVLGDDARTARAFEEAVFSHRQRHAPSLG